MVLKGSIVNYVQQNITTIRLAFDARVVPLVSQTHSVMQTQLNWFAIVPKDTLVLNVGNVLKVSTLFQHVASVIVRPQVHSSIKRENRYHVTL